MPALVPYHSQFSEMFVQFWQFWQFFSAVLAAAVLAINKMHMFSTQSHLHLAWEFWTWSCCKFWQVFCKLIDVMLQK
jgi:hypothetical protein